MIFIQRLENWNKSSKHLNDDNFLFMGVNKCKNVYMRKS